MSLTLDDNQAKFQIKAYRPGLIRINDTEWSQSVLVSASQLITDWPPQSLADLTAEHFNILLELRPAIVLLGTGTRLQFPPIELYGRLMNQGIGVEVMDTSAACRTFNALIAEERNVLAALLIQ